MSFVKFVFPFVLLIWFMTCVPSEARRRHKCRWDEYRSNGTCITCSACPKGTFVEAECSGTEDIKCEKCPAGTYTKHGTQFNRRCKTCSSCGLKNVIEKCISTKNTVCGDCPIGTYYDVFTMTCQVCSFCFDEYTDKDGNNFYWSKDCARAEIPEQFHCILTTHPPFLPPKLEKKGNGDEIIFYSDKKLEDEKSSTAEDEYYYDYYYDETTTSQLNIQSSSSSRITLDDNPPLSMELYFQHDWCIITVAVATTIILLFIFILFKCCIPRNTSNAYSKITDRK